MIDRILRHPAGFFFLLGLLGIVLGLVLGLPFGRTTWAVLIPVWAGVVLVSSGSALWARRRRQDERIARHLGLGLFFFLIGCTLAAACRSFPVGRPWMWALPGGLLIAGGLLLIVTIAEEHISEDDTGQKRTPRVDQIYHDHLDGGPFLPGL